MDKYLKIKIKNPEEKSANAMLFLSVGILLIFAAILFIILYNGTSVSELPSLWAAFRTDICKDEKFGCNIVANLMVIGLPLLAIALLTETIRKKLKYRQKIKPTENLKKLFLPTTV